MKFNVMTYLRLNRFIKLKLVFGVFLGFITANCLLNMCFCKKVKASEDNIPEEEIFHIENDHIEFWFRGFKIDIKKDSKYFICTVSQFSGIQKTVKLKIFESEQIKLDGKAVTIQITPFISKQTRQEKVYARIITSAPEDINSVDRIDFAHKKLYYFCQKDPGYSSACAELIKIRKSRLNCGKQKKHGKLSSSEEKLEEALVFFANLAAFLGNKPTGEPLNTINSAQRFKKNKKSKTTCLQQQ